MKVMKRKRSCNENLRASSAFDAKQMQLSIFPFSLWVSITLDCRSCLIFNMPDISRQRFSLAACYCCPNTICQHQHTSKNVPHFSPKERCIKISSLAGMESCVFQSVMFLIMKVFTYGGKISSSWQLSLFMKSWVTSVYDFCRDHK